MKRLKFDADLIQRILSGEKTSTWRLFDDKDLSVGDKLGFVNVDDDFVFAKAVITDIKEKTFAEITKEDFETHEKYSSKEEMLKTYQGYYGDEVNENSIVKIIIFELEKGKS